MEFKMIKELFLIEKNGKKINKKGWIWLVAAVPAALAALVWGINSLATPKAQPGSFESIIGSIPLYGWIFGILLLLVLWRSR